MRSTTELVTLKGGLIVPVSIVAWLIDAEARGLSFEVRDDRLRVSPAEAVTDADDAFIRGHRTALRESVTYLAEIAAVPL